MWMMGYNEGVEFSLPETFNGRKLRPLMPRPGTAASTYNGRTPGTSSLSHIHGADLLALNHHMAAMADQQSKREFNSQQVIVSSRWNPTPEQLQTLEELYRRGTRTPSTEEIQQITAQLRRFGKIEGKNVFYWFQNHKARERQKRRRQLESPPEEEVQQFFCDNNHDIEKKETGANGTDFEAEQRQTKNWAPPINCSTLAEEAAKAAIISECRAAAGWKQVEDEELQNPRPMAERNATWQTMQLCYSPHSNNHTTSTAADITPSTTTVVKTVDPKFKKPQEVNIFLAQPEPESDYHLNHFFSVGGDHYRAAADHEEEGYEKSQTLVLFPLRSGEDGKENGEEEETQTPSQFFEFLPVKN